MRAMIMAAGKGTRLRPLTDLMPKPMVPIANRPALYHILRLLRRHGFREVVLNLHHMADAITSYLGEGTQLEMELTYSYELELLGTAGGVKNNEAFLRGDTFLVISGDALTDIDLTGLIAAHRRNGSIATIAVKEVADPSLYGVLVVDDDGRVVGFQEKPPREEALSRLCNCGIYVFEPEIFSHILAGQFDDFGSRVFPALVRQHIPFHAHRIDAYWSDVGNLAEYVRGNIDALNRRVQVDLPGEEVRPGVWVEEDAQVPASVRLEPPVIVGQGSALGEGVVIEGPAVIGARCKVGAGAQLVRTLLLPGCTVPEGAVLVEGVLAQKS